MKPPESPLKVLSEEPYVRQRLHPGVFDPNYLHLSDLAVLIREIAPKVKGAVYDYGSGGAPYSSLFTQCTSYIAADLEAGPKVDRVLQADGMTGEAANSYDFVLSTQVLEHVRHPRDYLQECCRILRPGGQMLLTTHGMFQEHGCPHDYNRWTTRGLEELFLEQGFEIIRSGKLTTEIRGIAQLTTYFAHHLRDNDNRLLHVVLTVVRKVYLNMLMPLTHKFADLFGNQGIVGAKSAASIYVAIFVLARKPAVETIDSAH